MALGIPTASLQQGAELDLWLRPRDISLSTLLLLPCAASSPWGSTALLAVVDDARAQSAYKQSYKLSMQKNPLVIVNGVTSQNQNTPSNKSFFTAVLQKSSSTYKE